MMREIKFRARRSDTKGGWVYGNLIHAEQTNVWYIGTLELVEPVVLETVGQYTGLKDKNGAEIYEGDKVEYDYLYNEFDMPDGTGYWEWQRTWDVVEWETDMFSVDGAPLSCIQDASGWQHKGKYPFPDDYESGLKVIGNIHEE